MNSNYNFKDLEEGLTFQEIYIISKDVFEGFINTFHDLSPIHIDDDYAKASGFNKKIMHGAILNGFLSHFVGMVMPGKKAVLLTSEIRHHSPCYLNDELLFKFTLARKVESTRMLMLKFLVIRINEKKKVAYGKLQVLFKK